MGLGGQRASKMAEEEENSHGWKSPVAQWFKY